MYARCRVLVASREMVAVAGFCHAVLDFVTALQGGLR